MFAKPEPPPARPTHGSRIEAWLSETPDPFLDGPSPVVDDAELAEAALIESFEHAPKVVDSRPSTSGQRRRKVEYSHSVDQVAISAQRESVGSSAEPKKIRDVIGEAPNLDLQTIRRTGAKRSATSPPRSRKGSSPQRDIDMEDNGAKSGLINTPAQQTQPVIEPMTPRARPPNFQRHSPSAGLHQLSTIASVETLSIANEASVSQMSRGTSPAVEGNITSAQIQETGLKRRLTKHADLISVLSMPRTGAPSLRSARSIRTSRSRTATATLPDLMKEFRMDEDKFMREVNTLVDGVIPVLLSCVMSKSKSAIAAGLFDPLADPADDASITRSIVDMGIALERLKSLHERIPREDPQQLLQWAQGAQRVYRDYLQSWRMGFQDVIVNLAPANGETESLIGGLPRNKDGDVINGDGERVDVAFLLKRPLVRLKYLAKTFKGINGVRPSMLAEEQATIYYSLVTHARTRSNEERAKLEDHNADSIDPTRARDPRTLAPLVDATIERGRHVRARDYFSLELQHSSGQRVDCKVELLLRDVGEGSANAADLLICEVDASSRWLLFPPINTGSYSARLDDRQSELVVMIRGQHQSGQEWHELLSLRSEDGQAASDWVQMLGLVPEPPSSSRRVSFIPRQEESLSLRTPTLAPSVIQSRTPSPTEVDVPIGELSREQSKRCRNHGSVSSVSSPSHNIWSTDREISIAPLSHQASAYVRLPTTPGQTLKDLNDAMAQAGGSSSRLRRTKATRQSRPMEDSPISPRSPRSPRSTHSSADAGAQLKRPLSPLDSPCKAEERGPWIDERDSASRPRSKGYADLHGNTADRQAFEPSKTPKLQYPSPLIPIQRENHRRTSSVPSMDLPTINKVRKAEESSPQQEFKLEPLQMPGTLAAEEAKASPNVLRKSPRPQTPRDVAKAISSSPSPTTSTPVKLKDARTPRLRSPKSGAKSTSRRRSSSPLKHQYEPSSASATSECDESSTEKEDVASSDSSSEEELEDGDAPTPLLPLGALHRLMRASPKASLYSLPNGTLTPSQSASQAPYKTVPQQAAMATKTIASIFMWSERGSWDRMHPNECSIVIIPGLIEAYEMSAAHSEPVQVGSDPDTASASPRTDEQRPLVGLELTPLVPLRRGTALDISIRSPPTGSSQIQSGNNVMFRSRNPEECETLYHLINQSRIHNPTYIALQNARGPYGDGFGAGAGPRASARRSGWWGLGGRQKSYRAATTRGTPSYSASESSVGSMSSAFSALRRFGTGGRMFNIARSSVSFGGASRPQSVTSSETSGSSLTKDGTATPPDVFKGSPIGLSNTKIRLYQRETASKWRDMGSARLSITRPPANYQGKGFITGQERRVVVHGKTAGETLLDVCLGEAAFERVARTGIALSIWEEIIGPDGELGQVGAVGGVSARTTVYMIQVSSPRLLHNISTKTARLTLITAQIRGRDRIHLLASWEATILADYNAWSYLQGEYLSRLQQCSRESAR